MLKFFGIIVGLIGISLMVYGLYYLPIPILNLPGELSRDSSFKIILGLTITLLSCIILFMKDDNENSN